MDHDLDKLPQLLRQVITSSPVFLKKSSTYNNLVAMAATMVCNYNQTHGFSWRGHDPQSVFMNGCVHHYMRIASSTLQNYGIYYFIFDYIASLAGSAGTQNVGPVILSNICEGLRNENPYYLMEFFLSPPSKEHQRFRLYYKFAVIHSMVTGGPNVVNPYKFVDIFMSYHKKFNANECTYVLLHINMTMHVLLSYCCVVLLGYCLIVILVCCVVLSYCCVVVL